ncbi:MAG: CBS domain-containing protein [Alphaproteobacteria bacterium]
MTNGAGVPRRGPTVGDAMRREVVTIDLGAAASVAAQRMRRHDVGCLPVLERGRLVGMVTDRDLVVRGLADTPDLSRCRVSEVMSTGPLTIALERSVEDAFRLMTDTGLRRLLVVDDDARLIGLIAWHDLASFSARRPQARQVGFYRRMVDSQGHPHRIELFRLYVSPGVPANEVEPFAIERFEHVNGDLPWRRVADDYEVATF